MHALMKFLRPVRLLEVRIQGQAKVVDFWESRSQGPVL